MHVIRRCAAYNASARAMIQWRVSSQQAMATTSVMSSKAAPRPAVATGGCSSPAIAHGSTKQGSPVTGEPC